MTEQERLQLLQLYKAGLLSEKEETILLQILEDETKEEAFTDYELYAEEYIKIVDKNGEKVKFIHNNIQKKINNTVKKLKAAGKLVRILVLKARQHGVTTNEQGRMLYNTATKPNRTGLIVAHIEPTTKKIFNKAKYTYDNLPAHVKPLQRASNATELVFDRPTGYKGKVEGLNSKISIQTAGKVSIGRGDTLFYGLLSEFAFWEGPEGQEPLKQLSGITSAFAKTLDTEIVIETTANGFNDFKTLWDAAVAGENDWVPLFFAWYENPEYAMACSEEEYQRVIKNLDKKIHDYLFGTAKQKGWVQLLDLSKEQVNWWIWTFRNDNNSDLNMMKQENPGSPEEAFLATGNPVFDNEKVQLRISALKQKYKKHPPQKGHFRFKWNNPEVKDFIIEKSIIWVNDPNGFLTIYEPPKPGYPYVIGADTKGEGRDFYAGVVINNSTGNRTAVLRHCWTNSKPFTWQLYCLGRFYNMALIGVEMNFNTAPIEELERLNYPRQYVRRRYDDYTKAWKNANGWKTDGNTRPVIIDKEVDLIEENIGLINDIEMLRECLTFIRDKKRRPDARSGTHDDALFADMIGSEIREQQTFEIERKLEKKIQDFDHDTEHDDDDYEDGPFD